MDYNFKKSEGGPHIAIVGMACRFPGARNYDEFWENLKNGVNSIREIPPDRWDIEKYYSPDIDEPNRSISKWCGLVENFDRFDNRFFSISSREAASMDPQQRLLLEETWHCIEDAGVPLGTLREKKTSVHVGVSTTDYLQEMSDPEADWDIYAVTGNYECILANRISHILGFHGPSLSVDTGCAASLYAIHEAMHLLRSGRCDYAIAAGVSVNCHPMKYVSLSQGRLLSPGGQCSTFDKDADGYVPGDGIGVLLLQGLKEALGAGNNIHGIIRGSGVNHSGGALSLTAPCAEAQQDVILSAYEDAGFAPDTVTYVEAHGTGTSLGDPVEVDALTRAFREHSPRHGGCRIASVKSNIGHIEAASGMAGVIKVLMMLRNREIPPSLNFTTPNPVIDFENSPFEVAAALCDWRPAEDGLPLRAGVSAFGFGGANAHILLEEPTDQLVEPAEADVSLGPWPFLLSAKSGISLGRMIGEWQNFVRSEEYTGFRLGDICGTLMTGREPFPHRYGCLVSDKAELAEILNSDPGSLPEPAAAEPAEAGRLICLRIGKFSWDDLARIRSFSRQNPLFRENLENLEGHLAAIDRDLSRKFREGAGGISPLWSFLAGHAYLATLKDMGVCPDIIVGESAGLWNSLVLAGVMRPDDAIAVLTGYRKPDQTEFSRPNVMLRIPATGQTIMPYQFDESYIRLLTDDLRIPDDVFQYYVTRARLADSEPVHLQKVHGGMGRPAEAQGGGAEPHAL